MVDKHLNLFYTYNRDNELIENNLTRAFIVLLSIVPGQTRHRLLSTLLERSRKGGNTAVGIAGLEFTNVGLALQSNIDRSIPLNSHRKLLLTISTEPLVFASDAIGPKIEAEDKSENTSRFTSIPDAWIYDSDRSYCVLIEAKVGTYPLDIAQLQAHARDWFGSSLQDLDSRNSLYSVTWIDVLMVLRNALNDRSYSDPAEAKLLFQLVEFLGYYGYRLFDGFNLKVPYPPPDLTIARPSSTKSEAKAAVLGI